LLAASVSNVLADNWGVVVAGSNGYWNYRHQADACNAVKLLRSKGIPDSNIISLSWDDVANDSENPFPGKLFNKPTEQGVEGVDVYADCQIDYRNPDVTPDLFLAILEGNKDFVPPSGKKGKVLESTENDRVFIFFVDHGATGLVAFPTSYLYSDALIATLEKMHANKMYKELVFYLEACEAGSMFADLKTDLNIYATTASNAEESSWGTYCPPEDMINGKSLGTCLGDLYSVNWLEDVYAADLTKETLEEDYDTVKTKTTQSHVMQFGDLKEDTEVLKNFFASTTFKNQFRRPAHQSPEQDRLDRIKAVSSIDSRDIRLKYLINKYTSATSQEKKLRFSSEVQDELRHRDAMDAVFTNTVNALLTSAQALEVAKAPVHPQAFHCLKEVNKVVDAVCGRYSDYSLKYVRHVVYM